MGLKSASKESLSDRNLTRQTGGELGFPFQIGSKMPFMGWQCVPSRLPSKKTSTPLSFLNSNKYFTDARRLWIDHVGNTLEILSRFQQFGIVVLRQNAGLLFGMAFPPIGDRHTKVRPDCACKYVSPGLRFIYGARGVGISSGGLAALGQTLQGDRKWPFEA